MTFIRPVQRSIYNVFNPQGLKFLTRLRLGLSHLNEHRFRYNFKDCINPLCSFSLAKKCQWKQFHLISLNYLYLRYRKIFEIPLSKRYMNFYFILTITVLFISSVTKLFCLVILFTIAFTFPFLVTKYQLRHCWMYFILDFP